MIRYASRICLTIAWIGCLGSPVAVAQATQDADAASLAEAIKKVLTMDGPYTLAGSFSVYGYVVERTGTNVRFKPCTGKEIAVDESALVKSDKGCGKEAPGMGNPLSVKCDSYEPAPSPKFKELVAIAAASDPGTLYSEDAMGNYDRIDAAEPKAKSVYAEIESIKPCNGIVLGFGSSGLPVLQILEVNKQF